MDIIQKKKNRFLYLQSLYKKSDGNTAASFDMLEVGSQLKFDQDETERIIDYLVGENLIKHLAMGGLIGLTHWGIKEVEEALENPDKPTEHFLPINIINIGAMNNSTLQQATNASTINAHFSETKSAELNDVIHLLQSIQDTLNISIDLYKELISEIQTLKIQSNSPRPKSLIIAESLKTIRSILEGVGGNALTPVIVDQINRLLFK